jgi:hypothetical protein
MTGPVREIVEELQHQALQHTKTTYTTDPFAVDAAIADFVSAQGSPNDIYGRSHDALAEQAAQRAMRSIDPATGLQHFPWLGGGRRQDMDGVPTDTLEGMQRHGFAVCIGWLARCQRLAAVVESRTGVPASTDTARLIADLEALVAA